MSTVSLENMRPLISTHSNGFAIFLMAENTYSLEEHVLNCLSLSFIFQGVANRGASIRVGRDTEKNGKSIYLPIFSF